MIAVHPAYSVNTGHQCRCQELDVTCACNHWGSDTSTSGNVIYVHFSSNNTASTLSWVPRGWRTPKFRPHRNLYAAPQRFESQPLPIRMDLQVWLHRKPTRRATAKGVRNWRQQ